MKILMAERKSCWCVGLIEMLMSSCELCFLTENWSLINWNRSGVNFTNILRAAITRADPNSAKKTVKLSSFIALLGSSHVKAARKMLVKKTPDEASLEDLIRFSEVVLHSAERRGK